MDAVSQPLADEVGNSASQVRRICRALDLKPWQTRSWTTSHEPGFWAEAADVCGLYLSPPENAIVYSSDEKSGIQTGTRKNPTKPAIPDTPARPGLRIRAARGRRAVRRTRGAQRDVEGWVDRLTRPDNFMAPPSSMEDLTMICAREH